MAPWITGKNQLQTWEIKFHIIMIEEKKKRKRIDLSRVHRLICQVQRLRETYTASSLPLVLSLYHLLVENLENSCNLD